MNTPNSKLLFLFNKIDIPQIYMFYWLSVPEFEQAMLRLVNEGKSIDNRVVYENMAEIYNNLLPYKGTERAADYNFYQMRRGINKLSKALQQTNSTQARQ